MALLPENLSFSRKVLPIIAVVALIAAAIYVVTGLPDRSLAEPENQPPRAAGELANSARVAGAGVVEPSSEVIDIGTAISGLVTELQVAPGDFVEPGQPLFVVDQRSARARLQEANAAIGEARAAIRDAQATNATAQQQLALYNEIDDPAAVSRAEVIRAEGEASAARTRLELARARLSAAQAQASSARTELERLTVRAPIAGEILAVNIRPGEFVSTMGGSSQPFIQMGETRPLHIRIDIDEDEATRVERGAKAFVSPRGDAANQVEATFVRAEPLIVPKRSLTNSAAERVDVRVLQLIYALPDDARGSFTVGQQVDAFIPAVESAQ
ncbi:efflux RND transporter periplasmic adaptor subunit [Altererythrobacter lutimaris]|uniref:Efflux RND transporter periplasmic adaptor subunit n=1 Tax=Altererythrobacter lutimaris TaxID=2743979 RepID=A0A850HEV3_9SPHN|nr:efflux RND transporter periplasmic adaptor subunit [Altererythrobacter lutimaris]NVE95741.1 efflux RND transporter periplasmic adaptor subunit [Altererythrobacter lutimaris]